MCRKPARSFEHCPQAKFFRELDLDGECVAILHVNSDHFAVYEKKDATAGEHQIWWREKDIRQYNWSELCYVSSNVALVVADMERASVDYKITTSLMFLTCRNVLLLATSLMLLKPVIHALRYRMLREFTDRLFVRFVSSQKVLR